MSEVAKLQSDVLPFGLVREARPVFVYDSKLAKEKTGNAQRQAKHRELREAKGLLMTEVPREMLKLVKAEHGGDWLKFGQALLASGVSPEPPVGGKVNVHSVITTEKLKNEIESEGGIDHWLQKKIIFAIDSLPKPDPALPEIIEKIVEKPFRRLTPEQKISLRVGEKVRKITGWRAFIARKLLNI